MTTRPFRSKVSSSVPTIIQCDGSPQAGGTLLFCFSHVPSFRQEMDLPKIIFFDAANCIHSSHVGSDTKELDANLRAFFNHLILVISPLPRGRIGVEFYIFGNKLEAISTTCPADNSMYLPRERRIVAEVLPWQGILHN
jgi:hypothetical protein